MSMITVRLFPHVDDLPMDCSSPVHSVEVKTFQIDEGLYRSIRREAMYDLMAFMRTGARKDIPRDAEMFCDYIRYKTTIFAMKDQQGGK